MVKQDSITIWTEATHKGGPRRVSRCIDIAKALRDLDLQASFLVNSERAFPDRIEAAGFRCSIHPMHSRRTSKVPGGVVIIDTKRNVKSLVRTLKRNRRKVILLDNHTEASALADAVIVPYPTFLYDERRPNFYGGPEFVVIGENFLEVRERRSRTTHSLPLKVLVLIDDDDPHELVRKILGALSFLDDIEVNVVVPPSLAAHGWLDEMERACRNFRLFYGVKDLAPLMSISHIAFTTMNPAVYELAFMGVPSIILASTSEEVAELEAVKRFNIGIPLGYYRAVEDVHIIEAVEFFMNKGLAWEAISEMAGELTDGQGAWRIAHIIESFLDELHSEDRLFESSANGVCHA